MKDIIFRGKRTDNGEWVCGNLFIPDRKDTPTQICIGTNVIRITYDIDPSTVGQYTGLTDKNGKEIFENDIVLLKGDEEPYTVEFDECCFQVYGDSVCYVMDNFYDHDIEVIGNIHDNPELLKGGER